MDFQLTLENKRLREDLARQKLGEGGNVLDDDSVLETIEASFKQFHEFLDLLREAGYVLHTFIVFQNMFPAKVL